MRRAWVPAIVLLGVLGALIGSLAVRSDDGGTPPGPAGVGGGATSTSAGGSEAAVTTTASTATTATTVVQTPLPTGAQAVDALLAAWQAGDPAAAALVATPEAVVTLFAIPIEAAQARGCNSGNVNVAIQCVYRLQAGELQVRAVPNIDGSGYLVATVILGSP